MANWENSVAGRVFCPPLREQPSHVIVSSEPVRSALANRWTRLQILSEITQQEPRQSGPHIGQLLAGATETEPRRSGQGACASLPPTVTTNLLAGTAGNILKWHKQHGGTGGLRQTGPSLRGSCSKRTI